MLYNISLFGQKRFALNFLLCGNASKFVMLNKKENPMYFLSFFISSNFEFYHMNALVYANRDRGIHMVKLKNALNEKWENYVGFLFL